LFFVSKHFYAAVEVLLSCSLSLEFNERFGAADWVARPDEILMIPSVDVFLTCEPIVRAAAKRAPDDSVEPSSLPLGTNLPSASSNRRHETIDLRSSSGAKFAVRPRSATNVGPGGNFRLAVLKR